MWDLPGSRIKPVSPALAGGFFTTEPPGKPSWCVLNEIFLAGRWIDCWTNGLDLFSLRRFNVNNTILHPEIVEWWVWLVAVGCAQPRKERDPAVPTHPVSGSPSGKLVARSSSLSLFCFVLLSVGLFFQKGTSHSSVNCISLSLYLEVFKTKSYCKGAKVT